MSRPEAQNRGFPAEIPGIPVAIRSGGEYTLCRNTKGDRHENHRNRRAERSPAPQAAEHLGTVGPGHSPVPAGTRNPADRGVCPRRPP